MKVQSTGSLYQAPTEEKALNALERITEKWSKKYPNSMRSWKKNWDAISPIFKFSSDVTKKWSIPIRNWGQVYGELSIMYEGRLPE